MSIGDQGRTIAFLTNPKTYGDLRSDIVTIETHISLVILAGDRAFKLKRAVRLPYVDFSTVDLRLAACEREIELNRRTAPSLYLGVRHITLEEDGSLSFDGKGPVIDAVVEMRRLDQRMIFDALAAENLLTPQLLTETARMISRFHAHAPIHLCQGSSIMADVLSINERAFATSDVFAPEEVAALTGAFREALGHYAKLLDARGQAGKVRRCHGDLHLRNICLLDGMPALFDCIEFDDAIATIDVLYDLAFLLMDLWHRGRTGDANLVFNRYLDENDGADAGLSVIPFFMAVRSAIRAHVLATQSAQLAGSDGEKLKREAKAYFELSGALLTKVPARLIAIGGLSGSGKSTLASLIAHQIGPPPGARILSSDRIRKRLHGIEAESRLPLEAYRPEISEKVYATQASEATIGLKCGHAVIADAVFDRPQDRERIQRCAADAGVPFEGIWLEAPTDTLLTRVGGRHGDASDASTEVVRAQAARQLAPVMWKRISANDTPANIAQHVIGLLKTGRRLP
jgi:aminoglycoside phosphotransferase family enzyme/predicted kinase